MNLFAFVGRTFCVRLTETLVHFLWQGMAIGLLAFFAALWLRRSPSRVRYGVYVIALVLMAASPLATFWAVGGPESWGSADSLEGSRAHGAVAHPNMPGAAEKRLSSNVTVMPETSEVGGQAGARPKEDALPREADREFRWQRYAPYAATCYLAGVVLMLGRLLVAIHGGKRLRRIAVPVTDSATLASLTRWTKLLGLSVAPAVGYCRRVAVPTVVGIVRPTILLPLSLASGLSPEQVEMSILHELAHIRRYDHVVNIVQGVIEAVLFFHPAVWLVSRWIRTERENCCDDMVVAVGGKPLSYVSSLVEMAALSRQHGKARLATGSLHAAGNRSLLRRRVLRLLRDEAEERVRISRSWGVGLAMTLIVALAIAACLQGAGKQATGDPTSGRAKTPLMEGKFELNKETPIGLRAGEQVVGDREYAAVEVESVRFLRSGDEIQASVRLRTASIVQAKWRIGIALLTADRRSLNQSEALLETFLRMAGRPGGRIGLLHFTLGFQNELTEAARFRIALEREPDDAEVTASLTPEPNVSWGKAVNGLQAGISFELGERPYHVGESVSFVFKLRNVGSDTIHLSYAEPAFLGWTPIVVDAGGRKVPVTGPVYNIPVQGVRRSLAAGDTIVLGNPTFTIHPFGWQGEIKDAVVYAAPGEYRASQPYRFQASEPNDWSGELTSGRLNLKVISPDATATADLPGDTSRAEIAPAPARAKGAARARSSPEPAVPVGLHNAPGGDD